MSLVVFPTDCVPTFHPDTDAPLHEVSTVPLVVSFQVEMSESELRTMICHKTSGLGESDSTDSVPGEGRQMLDL